MQRARKEVVNRRGAVRRCRQRAVVDFLEKTFVTGTDGVGQFDVDNVPCHVTRLDLRLDLGDASAVILGNDAVTACASTASIGLNLRFLYAPPQDTTVSSAATALPATNADIPARATIFFVKPDILSFSLLVHALGRFA